MQKPALRHQDHLQPQRATIDVLDAAELSIAAVGSHSGLALGVSNALLEALSDRPEAGGLLLLL